MSPREPRPSGSGLRFLGAAPEFEDRQGLAVERLEARARVVAAANEAHRERFTRGAPTTPRLPDKVWINPPPNPALVEGAPAVQGAHETSSGGPGVQTPAAAADVLLH